MPRLAVPESRRGGERRSVVPARASRSLWLAALWTGAGAAIVCAVLGIVAVAISWLPVADTDGRAGSTIRAGLLTFLASLHGGVTVDGTVTAFVPLGLTVIVALACWRAGLALADTAAELGEDRLERLGVAALIQAGVFAVCCVLAIPVGRLGTSDAPLLGVGAAAVALALLAGGAALAWATAPLRARLGERLPGWAPLALRAGLGAVLTYLAAGFVLVAASAAVHHSRVGALATQVGGGFGIVPVIALSLLAIPNAVIAAGAYLAGPGFAVGVGTSVNPFAASLGTVPAFPILGALPGDGRAPWPVWVLAAVTVAGAGAVFVRTVLRAGGWTQRLRVAGGGIAVAAVVTLVLAWQAGGRIGEGALASLGPSPLLVTAAVSAQLAVLTLVGFAAVAVAALIATVRDRRGVVGAEVVGAEVVGEPVAGEEPEAIPASPEMPAMPQPTSADEPEQAEPLAG